MDNDDDGDDTLADTVAGTDAGSQNTPSQWKKHFAEQVPPLQVASPPRALPLCTYDEDETQILFCSNVISQEVGSPGHQPNKNQMQLAEVELPLVPHENYVGDGDSSNESEDLWTIGDSTLDQPHPTFDGPVDGAIPNAASTTEASAHVPEHPVALSTSTDTADDDTELEDNDIPTYVVTHAVDTPVHIERYFDNVYNTTMTTLKPVRSPSPRKRLRLEHSHLTEPPQPPITEPSDPFPPPPPISNDIVVSRRRNKRNASPSSTADHEPHVPSPPRRRRRQVQTGAPSTVGRARAGKSRRAATLSSSIPCLDTATSLEANKDPPPSISGVRIVLTGLDPAPLMHQIHAIQGAAFEQDVTRGTHLVAPSNQLKRTVKMLCGISTCLHIVDEKWLAASAKLGRPAPEVPYCLLDLAKQAQWSFELKATMYDHTNRHLLLRGRVFYIVRHKSILPAPSDLAKIIECAGGEVLSTSTKPVDNVIVIASAEALAVKSVQKQLGPLANATKYTTELVLSGVLQQSLDLTTTHVVVEHTSSQQQPTIQRGKR
ncbi:hypothetical protein H257_06115 [Aphanomyces astaci]|uniref:BRCT domain-containing protein n=1 Tax=Aphanomyces astaci TaxID=112090 RepID=W4GLQ2_APHAT|nr:hypothetical protein H257_06115 [Aphanomyces astaci]ETV80582.1 hypothetical protein H257_06115 [Aphanomyces astaci]|eukprot:XP_009829529.1 hypothetical protein H257_06115 [Aphanomyces astaci]